MFRTCRHCVNLIASAIVVVSVLGTASALHAGIILPGTQTGSGPGGSGNGFVNTTLAPNNDTGTATGASSNFVSLAMTFTALGPIDYGFVVASSTGTTEYLYGNLIFNNVTGVPWTDFHLELINAPAGLDFDTPDKDPTPTSSVFTALNHQATTIDWSGGVLTSGNSMILTFSIDVPDLGVPVGGFILRSLPTIAVPEPASLLLLGFGFVGLGAWRRYRSQG